MTHKDDDTPDDERKLVVMDVEEFFEMVGHALATVELGDVVEPPPKVKVHPMKLT